MFFVILTFSPTIFPYAPLYLLPIRGKSPSKRFSAAVPRWICTPLQPRVARSAKNPPKARKPRVPRRCKNVIHSQKHKIAFFDDKPGKTLIFPEKRRQFSAKKSHFCDFFFAEIRIRKNNFFRACAKKVTLFGAKTSHSKPVAKNDFFQKVVLAPKPAWNHTGTPKISWR